MIDESFYYFDNGSFGELRCIRKRYISNELHQKLLDDNSREYINSCNPPPGLTTSDYINLFTQQFLKGRQSVNEYVEEIFVAQVQTGNSESVKCIHIIENDESFIRWENPYLVEQFIKFSNMYISGE